MLPREKIGEMAGEAEKEMIEYHFGLGTWIRNNWGLWPDSGLSEYFNSPEIFHTDDMSLIILKSYLRRLNSRPIELDERIEFNKEFWMNNGR